MVIALANDHAGFELKEAVKAYLESEGIEYKDMGTYSAGEKCDYPDAAKKGADAIISGECDRGLFFCGTGIGISMAANKVKGIRAACCSDYFSAKFTRAHNDANVLCMGGRVVGAGLALEMVKVFLATEFEGGRHSGRVDKMMALEQL